MKNGEHVIEVRGMTKRFGELTAVDHVDLTVVFLDLTEAARQLFCECCVACFAPTTEVAAFSISM